MDAEQVARRRLANLGLTSGRARAPVELVGLLGAVQAQDYGPALWSIGARTGLAVDEVQRAIEEGDLIRTHALRPTWHLVRSQDVRWLQELTCARVHALNAYYYRRVGLDAAVLERSRRIVADALGEAGELTRAQVARALTAAGVDVSDLRLPLILMNAELTATIGSGRPKGKQQTYALLEARASEHLRLTPDEALAELTWRYFSSHGPASVRDFGWWSSLPRTDILRGLELVGERLRRDDLDGVSVWSRADDVPAAERGHPPGGSLLQLVQAYDEYIVGYTQTKFVLDLAGSGRARPEGIVVGTHALLVDGQLTGRWRRTVTRRSVTVELTLDRALSDDEEAALAKEVDRHGDFLHLEAQLTVT